MSGWLSPKKVRLLVRGTATANSPALRPPCSGHGMKTAREASPRGSGTNRTVTVTLHPQTAAGRGQPEVAAFAKSGGRLRTRPFPQASLRRGRSQRGPDSGSQPFPPPIFRPGAALEQVTPNHEGKSKTGKTHRGRGEGRRRRRPRRQHVSRRQFLSVKNCCCRILLEDPLPARGTFLCIVMCL